MFSLIIQTNRLPSMGGCYYFLHVLFLLHICTAFLTIITAFNNNLNDNEGLNRFYEIEFFMEFLLAIIQLSMDSIHVVKSSDPHTTVSFVDSLTNILFTCFCRTLKLMIMMKKNFL